MDKDELVEFLRANLSIEVESIVESDIKIIKLYIGNEEISYAYLNN